MTNHEPQDEIQTIWQTQQSEPLKMSVEELRLKAHKFEKRIRSRNLREYIAAAVVIVAFAVYIVIFPNPLMRAGCALIIAASFYVAYHLRRHGSAQPVPDQVFSTSGVAHLRAELVRQRDLLRSVTRWYIAPFIPGLVLFVMGIESMRPAGTGPPMYTLPVVAIVLVIWFLNRRGAKKLQREIDRLDAVER